jgi:hypothetical protein
MPTPKEIAARFSAIDAHDDTVEGFVILPPTGRRNRTTVEVTLFRHWKNTRRVIRFSDCANVGVALDGDILAHNWPINTHSLDATTDRAEIESLMRWNKRSWNVRYDKSIDPFRRKLASAKRSVLFRVRIFGGLLAIVARSFTVRRAATSAAPK